ncbi:SgcJ/EcaC family oxidoreductase [Amycolatopsis sp. QT-25]|uniref:SgcJ/EcaC family oxidoreductase n=1 Tax=Amycolatopsis sp. QT-25 TaxID=3034022 RepID=UPI0023EC1034|nr:SgcJ/EcaC family oxidoreductase [Amycolatopsis sp. QT-25]WET83072.1 SgcJ/EcaC family oxidoreductase [Amycolatopsis sp. QT-25]
MSTSTRPGEELSESDKVAIAALTRRVIAAWAYHDADAFADLFTEDGTMILSGVYRNGREDIRSYLKSAFQNEYKGTQVTGQPLGLRPLARDAAVLLSRGGVLQPGESEVSDANAIRASWVVVNRDGQWFLAAYQNSPI